VARLTKLTAAIELRRVSGRRRIADVGVAEVDAGQGLEVEAVLLEVLPELRAEVAIHEGGQRRYDPFGARARREQEVGVEVVRVPLLQQPRAVGGALHGLPRRPRHGCPEREVGVWGDVAHHACDDDGRLAVEQEPLAHRVGVAEVGVSERLGEDDAVGLDERRRRIALEQGEGEHAEQRGVGVGEPLLFQADAASALASLQ
jgi:hypothetical protein